MNSTTCPECGAGINKPGSTLCPACLLSLGAETQVLRPVQAGLVQLPCEMGGYHLVKKLGAGGMGVVYLADQVATGRRVALKVLSQSIGSDKERERFLREGRLAATIDHPNSVYVYGSEEIDGVPVIVMEAAGGGTLRDELKRRGAFPVRDAVDAILEVVDGLEAALEKGVLHRDMKPANCFVNQGGKVMVGDYGLSISKAVLAEADEDLTRSGMIMGTPAFSPPEQLRGQTLDHRADIYSTGATLYYLLSGRAPVETSSAVEAVATVLEGRIPPLRKLRPDVPVDLAELVMRCLSVEAARRPRSYAELRQALVPFSSAVPEPAPLSLRFLAGVLDFGLLSLIFGVVARIREMSGASGLDSFDPIYGALLTWMLFAFSEGAFGTTPGKWICGLEVSTSSGGRPGMRRATLRALAYLLPTYMVAVSYGPDAFLGPGGTVAGVPHLLGLIGWLALTQMQWLLFIPAFRRADHAGWHDQMVDVRVVLRRKRPVRRQVVNVLSTSLVEGAGGKWGPYEPGISYANDLRSGYDPVLRRQVLMSRRKGPGPSAARRECCRAGRLRWIQSVTDSPGDVWDVWQALSGEPLRRAVATRALEWGPMVQWLRDLVDELDASQKDGTTPARLAPGQVWITTEGRAVLLDEPWPGPGNEETFDPKDLQLFLYKVAAAVDPTGRPLHADVLVEGLRNGSFDRVSHIAGNLAHISQKPADVSNFKRAACIWGPILAGAMYIMVGVKLMEGAVIVSRPSAGAILPVPAPLEEMGAPMITLAGARMSVTSASGVADVKEVPKGAHDTSRSSDRMVRLPGTVMAQVVVSLVVAILFPLALFQLTCILAFGSPFLTRLAGVAAVSARQRPAGRWRMVWRWFIGWSPPLLAGAVLFYMKGTSHWDILLIAVFFWLSGAFLVLNLASLWRGRSLLDRLAGTWPVAR